MGRGVEGRDRLDRGVEGDEVSVPSKANRDDFRGYCRNATTRQLHGIIEKEEDGAKRSPERAAYAEIARAELAKREGG